MGLLVRHGQFLPPWNPGVAHCCVCTSSWERESREHVYWVEAQKGGMITYKTHRTISRSQRGKEGRGFPAWLPACLSHTLQPPPSEISCSPGFPVKVLGRYPLDALTSEWRDRPPPSSQSPCRDPLDVSRSLLSSKSQGSLNAGSPNMCRGSPGNDGARPGNGRDTPGHDGAWPHNGGGGPVHDGARPDHAPMWHQRPPGGGTKDLREEALKTSGRRHQRPLRRSHLSKRHPKPSGRGTQALRTRHPSPRYLRG